MKASSKRLIIDTATAWLYVGLFDGDTCILEHYEKGQNNHSVTLMPTIERLFKEAGWTIDAIDAFVVGIGPGSYTGVRIGVVVAKMFAWTTGKPLFKVSSLALIASGTSRDGLVMPVMDARRGNAFMALYEKRGNRLSLVQEERHGALAPFKDEHPDASPLEQAKPDLGLLLDSGLLVAVDSIHHLAPVYLRKTEAERNLDDGR